MGLGRRWRSVYPVPALPSLATEPRVPVQREFTFRTHGCCLRGETAPTGETLVLVLAKAVICIGPLQLGQV